MPTEAEINKTIGVNIRNIRRFRRLSQSELGEHLGVSFQQVQKFEKGTNRISAAALVSLADKMKVNILSFVGEDGNDVLKVGQAELVNLIARLPKKEYAAVVTLIRSITEKTA